MSAPDEEVEPSPTASGRPIVIALAALITLTLISWIVSLIDLGSAGSPVAIGIACIKAAIVAIAFMEIPRASMIARVVALVTLSFIALLCAGTIGDVAMR
jgi:caa(3)-type oxidase subunit IV